MYDFTDFVTFSNAWNDTCFVKQTFFCLTRLFAYAYAKSLVKQKKVCLTKSRAKSHAKSRFLHQMRCAFFTDFVTFSNAQNDTCFVNQTFSLQKVWLTKQVSFRALLKVTKWVKSHILFGVRNEISHETL